MGVFAAFTFKEFILGEKDEKLRKVAAFIEKLIEEGDKKVKYAAQFGFLEGITNNPPDTKKFEAFICYLGPKSREFCQALDKFWGTKTKGVTK